MGHAQTVKRLRSAVFRTLGDPASVNGSSDKVHLRLLERDEGLVFGQGLANAASIKIEAPRALGLKKGDLVQFDHDERTFRVNSAPVLVRSGVHSLSCEVVK